MKAYRERARSSHPRHLVYSALWVGRFSRSESVTKPATSAPDDSVVRIPQARDVAGEIAERATALEAQNRVLFDRHPHPMWIYDLETLAILAVNDAAVRAYGYSREELL